MESRQVVIIGSGPAGYAAAIYTARAQLNPLILAGEQSGGQLMLTTVIENYPGFLEGIQGPQLMLTMRHQAEKFGAEILDQKAIEVDFKTKPFQIKTETRTYEAKIVIITTGAESIQLGSRGESQYIGRGVSYCAVCDAAFFRGKEVFVVGGGDAAMEDTLALTKFARKITLIHRRDTLKASKIMQQRVLEEHKDKISVRWNSEVVEVIGDGTKLTGLKIKNLLTGKIEEVMAEGLFVAIGHMPANEFLRGQLDMDEKGYVVTRLGLNQASVALAQKHLNENKLLDYPTMTSVPGVFAAGDNVDFRYRQAATAAGYGVMAALDAEWWLERGE
jgi:thioredoxin reductase (NADPH)